jgi:hypothetical protein
MMDWNDISGLELTLGNVFAMAQALDLAVKDAVDGECKDCPCSTCETLRGLSKAVPQ